jgi:two-component system, sensor histidine kinase
MSDSGAARIERECIHALYQQGPQASIIAVVIGGAIVAAMWQRAPHAVLLTWYALVLANQTARIALMRAFVKERPADARVGVWARRYLWTMFAGGALFGSVAIVLWPPDDALGQTFLLMVIVGMAAGSIAANAFHPPTLFAYLVPLIVPSILRLAFSGGLEYGLLAFSQSFYFLALVVFGRNQAQLLRRSIALGHENIELVSELRRKTGIAEAAQMKAEQASTAKSRFFAAASHDLRQPLQAVGLYAASLRDAKRDPEDARKIDQILSGVDALESLFDELLDISKLDAGYVVPNLGHFPARVVFERLEIAYFPLARKSQLSLEFRGGETVVYSDPVLLERVLANLVSNGLRYTEAGGVTVACEVRDAAVTFSVEDTGIGIPREEHERVFDEFYQLENPERDRRKGLGLGLATVKRITQLLGYPMTMASEVGRGTSFHLDAPAGDPARAAIAPAAPAGVEIDALRGRHVLVIEDEAIVREGLVQLLGDWGCRVVAAASTAEAIAVLDHPPEVVVADYRLREGQSGIDAIAALRERFGSALPAILVTGDTAPEIFSAARENRLPLLTKPVRAARLRAALAYLLGASRDNTRAAA